jgi:hypothetical protein
MQKRESTTRSQQTEKILLHTYTSWIPILNVIDFGDYLKISFLKVCYHPLRFFPKPVIVSPYTWVPTSNLIDFGEFFENSFLKVSHHPLLL